MPRKKQAPSWPLIPMYAHHCQFCDAPSWFSTHEEREKSQEYQTGRCKTCNEVLKNMPDSFGQWLSTIINNIVEKRISEHASAYKHEYHDYY